MSAADLVEEFAALGDWEERFRYILELGRELPPMDPANKTEETRISGCQSRVWIKSDVREGDPPRLHFTGDSDSGLVKGLVAIVFDVYNDQTPQTILDFDIHRLFAELDLSKHLTPSRSNGLNQMVLAIRATAERVGRSSVER